MPTTTEIPTPRRPAKAAPPPPWAIETFIARLGKGPAVLGRFLDRLARFPPPIGWIIRIFSQVWVGILFLILTGTYIAIGSGFASLRARLEMTDLQFFDAWPMITLLVLLATSLIVVTLRKIPFTLYKLGVWTVHIGILVMLTGCFIYFSQKVEGMTRIFLGQSVNCFYDSTEAAMYITRLDPADMSKAAGPEIMVRLPDLPFFNEHLANMPDGTSNPLAIAIPPAALSADPRLKNLNLTITGYYPYANMASVTGAGPATQPAVNPAVRLFKGGGSHWLLANIPTQRIRRIDSDSATLTVEFLAHPASERVAALSAPFAGSIGITVRIPKFNVNRTYAVAGNVPIPIEGTPYTLTPRDIDNSIPMVSKGYEGAPGNALIVDVARKDGDKTVQFQRRALLYFPERSPDFTPDGKRVQDRVDNDIEITYHDASEEHLWIILNADDSLSVIHRAPGGAVQVKPAKAGDVLMQVDGVDLFLAEYTPHAIPFHIAQIVPPTARQLSMTATEVIMNSAVDVHVQAGTFDRADVPVPFIEFAGLETSSMGREPAVIDVPGVGPLRLVLSTTRRPLPSTLSLTKFELVKYANAATFIEDYRSNVHVTDNATHAQKDVLAHMNSPAEDNGLYLFQAQWDNPAARDFATEEERDAAIKIGPRYTTLGVANRPGIRVMITGAILIIAGILYSFYVKPVLLNKRKKQLADHAATLAA